MFERGGNPVVSGQSSLDGIFLALQGTFDLGETLLGNAVMILWILCVDS